MKTTYPLLLTALFMGLLSSCGDDDDGTTTPEATLEIQWHLKHQGQPVSIDDTLELSNGKDFVLKKFMLYISQVQLVTDNGDREKVSDVFLYDYSVPELRRLQTKIAPGNYQRLDLGFGVDAAQNDLDPTSFPREHPLSSYQQTYWSMLKYRFAIIEGRSNTRGQLGSPDDILNAWHPGTNPLYRPQSFALSASLASGKTTVLRLELDIDDLITADPAIDLDAERQSHSEPNDIDIARKIMDKISSYTALRQGS